MMIFCEWLVEGVNSLAGCPYTEDSILNAPMCDLKGIEMESKILDSAKKNTTEAKFQHYQIYKQVHAESTFLRAFRVLCGELMTAVTAFILVTIELKSLAVTDISTFRLSTIKNNIVTIFRYLCFRSKSRWWIATLTVIARISHLESFRVKGSYINTSIAMFLLFLPSFWMVWMVFPYH